MVNDGTMSHLNGTWVNIKKGKIKMKNKPIKKYVVMSKFKNQDRFMLEKQFVNRHSADHYAELMTEAKDYDELEYFLFEQSNDYQNKEKEYDFSDSIPF